MIEPSKDEITWFRRKLISWYSLNGRNFSWRNTTDPYKILMAEIMLQRTRAIQVENVYNKFIRLYPNVSALNNSDLNQLENLLSPLGLNQRHKNLKILAKVLINEYGGVVPSSREKLLSLPNVGNYITGALLSTAFKKREWIVDTNVVRLYKRYFGLTISGEARRNTKIISIAKSYSNTSKPRISAYAVIDLPGLICKPHSPKCDSCPLRPRCKYN